MVRRAGCVFFCESCFRATLLNSFRREGRCCVGTFRESGNTFSSFWFSPLSRLALSGAIKIHTLNTVEQYGAIIFH